MNSETVLVGLGEVLWDVFPDGAKFGGAPANFACTAAGLRSGALKVAMVSAVGSDQRGQDALKELGQHDVDTTWVEINDHPTGEVLVKIDADGKASYEFASDTAWDNIQWNHRLRDFAADVDAVCFGSLGQRDSQSRSTIRDFVAAMRDDALRVFDINLRPPFYSDEVIKSSLKLANVLKLNDDELPILAELYDCQGTQLEVLQQLASQCNLRSIALTQGADGALLLRGDEVDQAAGVETELVDTVGAGDAFTAAFVLGLLSNKPLDQINRDATRVAAYVCSQAGATPPMPFQI